MNKYQAIFVAFLFFALVCSFSLSAQSYSRLWGKAGESWLAAGRLPDFSYAGYHSGEKAIPDSPITANVKDFGAVGDGQNDDTDAFKRAIQETDSGAIFIPAGRYLITDVLDIQKSNLVLRGAGPEKTTVFCPKYLSDIHPNWGATTSGRPTSNYSWSGGFIRIDGDYRSEILAKITSPAQRGTTTLQLSSTGQIKPGRRVEIFQKDLPDNSLARHLYSGDPGDMSKILGRTHASIVVTVQKIEGNYIVFDRPLRFDVRLKWQPVIRQFEPTVTEAGIENLGFEFPVTDYQGHFTELGHNAIAISRGVNCWLRNIAIKNADSGIFVSGKFCTVQNVVFQSDRKPDKNRNSTGHHGFDFSDDDNLFSGFDFQTRFIHDITVSHCAGNVISKGKGVDLCFDHHKRSPYENLFTQIDIGAGTRMWRCGGGKALGRQSGARETFWNIRAQQPQNYPEGFGPASMNLIGITTDQSSQPDMSGRWFEAILPDSLFPQNLHQAQLRRRLSGKPKN